jgi:dCMP deaminase
MSEKINPYDSECRCVNTPDFMEVAPNCPDHARVIIDHVQVAPEVVIPQRPSIDQYFLAMAELASSRATCDRAHVGCVLVREKNVVATGFNGSVAGLPHCDDVGHQMDDGHCVRTVHAEMNALVQAAKLGHATKGATAYINVHPCWLCFKMLANAGIVRIVYSRDYRNDPKVAEAAAQAGITIDKG